MKPEYIAEQAFFFFQLKSLSEGQSTRRYTSDEKAGRVQHKDPHKRQTCYFGLL